MNAETFNWNLVISAVTLIVAIFSPVIVTVLNSAHNTKIRKLELKYEKQSSYFLNQQSVFDNYIAFAAKQIESDYQSERTEYMRYYGELFMYVPEYYWGELETLHKYIQSRDRQNAKNQFVNVTKTLGKTLQESDLKFPKL